MRLFAALLILVCAASVSTGQYVETTVLLPDSLPTLMDIRALVYHSTNSTIYAGGSWDSTVIAVDARTNTKLAGVSVGPGPHRIFCSDPPDNKVYCANYDSTVTVIDGATNQVVRTFAVEQQVSDFVYNEHEGKLYCGNDADTFLRVIDCSADTIVSRVAVSFGPRSLCYSPRLNRIYCAHLIDQVTVIDCAADTVVNSLWVRGVVPIDICYDSATNCVYTANYVSNTVSVIRCGADTLLRLVPTGLRPSAVIAGPPGKVYCANDDDSSVTVIADSATRTVGTIREPSVLSYDPVNRKVYCSGYRGGVTVIDAVPDTVLATIATWSNADAPVLCYNPASAGTYAVDGGGATVAVIGGETNTVETVIALGRCYPGPLCYSLPNNRLYCLGRGNGLLYILDCDSNRLVKLLKTRGSEGDRDTLIWNPFTNKVYVTSSGDGVVSILDCSRDSIVAVVAAGELPSALCSGDSGKVYVATQDRGVAVIDGSGDSVLTVVPVNGSAGSLCFDRAGNKVYVGRGGEVCVIDADADSLVATLRVPGAFQCEVCWNQNYDKVYACDPWFDTVSAIDCATDTVITRIRAVTGLDRIYSDSVCGKVYFGGDYYGFLRVLNAANDTLHDSLMVDASALLDNGRQGPANRLFCAVGTGAAVAVVAGYKTDSVLRRVGVGQEPSALAWNPLRSRMYVSNYGSSSISVIRDTFGVGVEESQPRASSYKPQATVVRGVLFLDGPGENGDSPSEREDARYSPHSPVMSRAALLDISGRKVLTLKAGANDVRALAPGIYFVTVSSVRNTVRACKVVIAR